MKHFALFTSVAATLLLSACGSGGSDNVDVTPPVVVNEVPATALASATAFTSYAKALSDKNEEPPVGVNNVAAPPVSETEAPLPM
jgi:hypothetical protein